MRCLVPGRVACLAGQAMTRGGRAQVTKVDMCPANILKQTLDELTKILKSAVS
jgi:hypothetical protein